MLLIKPLSYLFFVAAVAAQSGGPLGLEPTSPCLGSCFAETVISGGAASGCADAQTSNGIETCLCTDQTFTSAVTTCLSSTCPNQVPDISESITSYCQNGPLASGPDSGPFASDSDSGPFASGSDRGPFASCPDSGPFASCPPSSSGGLGGAAKPGPGAGNGKSEGASVSGGAAATLVYSGATNAAVVLVSLFLFALQ